MQLTDATFADKTRTGTVLVEFWAQWCGPCHMLSPVLDEIDRERDDLTVLKINADENTATARDYQVMSLPTMLLFRDGVPIRQIVGARPKGRLLAELMTRSAPEPPIF